MAIFPQQQPAGTGVMRFCYVIQQTATVIQVPVSYGISSVVRTASGDYTVIWSQPFQNTYYMVMVTSDNIGGNNMLFAVTAKTPASVSIEMKTSGGAQVATGGGFSLMAIGV